MDERIRWARKVSQAKIRQLYQLDALGIRDGELIDRVSEALYARCQSILLVSKAQFHCPRCGSLIQVQSGRSEEERLECPAAGCNWQTTHRQWHHSWQHQDLIGTRAALPFEKFIALYGEAKSPGQKMVLIDELIHAFHQGIVAGMPHRSAANNLIEGSYHQVVALLDGLAYGEGSTPGFKENLAEWRQKARQAEQVRRG